MDNLALGILILVLLVVAQVFATLYYAVNYYIIKIKYENLLQTNVSQQSDHKGKCPSV